MKVVKIDIHDERWKALIDHHPMATIFHTPEWIGLIANMYHYNSFILSLIDEYGQIHAGIPFMEIRSVFGKTRWISLSFTDHCAPISSQQKNLDELLNFVDQITSNRSQKAELRWDYPGFDDLRKKKEHVLHLIDLSNSFPEVASKIHPMHTRNARYALSHNVTIVNGTELELLHHFYRLHLLTRRKQGVPIQPWKYFQGLQNRIIERSLGFISCAFLNDRCIAAAVFLTWNKVLTYKYGASDPAYLKYRPNDLLFWNAIQWGCENGFTVLDLGRTDLENVGLRSYKSRWGAREIPLSYCYSPTVPGSRSNFLMNILSTTIKHSPQWVCRLSGEILYRYAS